MKFLFTNLVLLTLTACTNQAVYSALHEKQRQDCLKQGRDNCHRVESYKKYKQKREDEMKPYETY